MLLPEDATRGLTGAVEANGLIAHAGGVELRTMDCLGRPLLRRTVADAELHSTHVARLVRQLSQKMPAFQASSGVLYATAESFRTVMKDWIAA